MSTHFTTNTASGHSPLDLKEKSKKRFPHPVSACSSAIFFRLKCKAPFHFFTVFFQERRKAKRVKKNGEKSNMTAQETTNRTLWDAGFLFLGKTEKCRPSIRSPPSCGFQCCASIHPLPSSLHTHIHTHTHTHKLFVTHSHTQTGYNSLHEDVVGGF